MMTQQEPTIAWKILEAILIIPMLALVLLMYFITAIFDNKVADWLADGPPSNEIDVSKYTIT